MARKEINVGTSPNKGDGDPLRTAFRKINENFAELYTGNFAEPDVMTSTLAPDTDGIYDLGKSNKRWADLYVKDFIYLNGSRIELTSNGTLLINGGPPAERQDTVGSVFADDSTVMVDGIAGKVVGPVDTTTVDATIVTATNLNGLLTGNVVGNVTGDVKGSVFADDSTVIINGTENSINLDGTVKGNIIPDADEAYDIGSMTHKFRDLYLSGSTINLGGVEITNDGGVITFGGEKVVVEGGTGDVKGSVFGDDSTLLVDSIESKIVGPVETTTVIANTVAGDLTGNVTGDVKGSVFGDDSVLLVDAVNSIIPKSVVQDSANWDTAYAWGDHAAAGYLVQSDILDGTLTIDVNNTGDLQGSVFGDDSTLLVDSLNSTIVGDVENGRVITGIVKSATDADLYVYAGGSGRVILAGQSDVSIGHGSGQIDIYGDVEFNNGTTSFQSGNDVTFNSPVDFNGTVNFDDATIDWVPIVSGVLVNNGLPILPTQTLDISGSVFADDSTVVVDGTNANVTANILTSNTAANFNGTLSVVGTTQLYDTITISGGDIISDDSAYFFGNLECSNISNLQNNAFASDDLTLSAERHIVLDGDARVTGSFKPPMLTQVEIDALTPTLGMMVYNTTTGKFQGYAADANNDSTTGWADLH
jgi:hypothetical protein